MAEQQQMEHSVSSANDAESKQWLYNRGIWHPVGGILADVVTVFRQRRATDSGIESGNSKGHAANNVAVDCLGLRGRQQPWCLCLRGRDGLRADANDRSCLPAHRQIPSDSDSTVWCHPPARLQRGSPNESSGSGSNTGVHELLQATARNLVRADASDWYLFSRPQLQIRDHPRLRNTAH